MTIDALHTPVLLRESVDYLVTKKDGIYIDATLGMGGYSELILNSLSPKSKLLSFDVDDEAIALSQERLSRFNNINYIQSNFDNIKVELFARGVYKIDGIVYDLGVSSLMLDKAEKGFSYMHNGPLDMRMNADLKLTAADILNNTKKDDLANILFKYGEEKNSRAIAQAITTQRLNKKYADTFDLVDTIKRITSPRFLNKTLSRVFQALRISVNSELQSLEKSLKAALEIMNPGGRIVVISYHSLEDRIVKQYFKDLASDCVCPPGLPICICNHPAKIKLISRKPILPQDSEIKENIRSRSAKLRVAEVL